MSTQRRALLPSLLLSALFIGFWHVGVLGQEVSVTTVSTHYLEVSWTRTDQWFGEKQFNVTLYTSLTQCNEVVPCDGEQVVCSFNSGEACGALRACEDVNVTVATSNYVAPQVSVLTAPDSVQGLNASVSGGNVSLVWTNPESACHQSTMISITISGYQVFQEVSATQDSYSRPLCVAGQGIISLYTKGGNGTSESKTQYVTYIDSDVIPLVKMLECGPPTCQSIVAHWQYNSLCPEVAKIRVWMGDEVFIMTNSSNFFNSHEFTGLWPSTDYDLHIQALTADDRLLGYDSTTCSTKHEAVTVMQLNVTGPNSILVTWETPDCTTNASGLHYQLSAIDGSSGYTYDIYVTDTTYYWTGLDDYTNWTLCVQAYRYYETYNPDICQAAYTPPTAPYYINIYRHYLNNEPYVYIYWGTSTYYYDQQFVVMWGDKLQYSDITDSTEYTFYDYSNPVDLVNLCVMTVMPFANSTLYCEDYLPNLGDNSSSPGEIVGWTFLGLAIVAAIVMVIVFVQRKNKRNRNTGLQQTTTVPRSSYRAQTVYYNGAYPTAQPAQNSGAYPTAQPAQNSGAYPTAQPGQNSGAYPTAQPAQSSGAYPTAQPAQSSGAYPTAQPSQSNETYSNAQSGQSNEAYTNDQPTQNTSM